MACAAREAPNAQTRHTENYMFDFDRASSGGAVLFCT